MIGWFIGRKYFSNGGQQVQSRMTETSVAKFPAGTEVLATIGISLETRIIDEKLDLPLLPKVAGSVISMTQDEDSNMAGLAQLIQGDQALASRVMKIANSPLYRGVSPMTSLQQAIARLGMTTVGEMALAASLGDGVFSVKGYESEISWLWRHSLACGWWAKEIARILRRNVESAFLCGLLHQIGKPVTLQTITDIQESLGVQISVVDMQTLIQKYYIPVGLSLARSWQLPGMVLEAIEFHLNYRQAEQFRREATIAAGACLLADELLCPGEMDIEQLMDSDVMEDLNLYEDDVTRLTELGSGIVERLEAMAI
jgi:putative nucleotidyltransferase with HDIG domain